MTNTSGSALANFGIRGRKTTMNKNETTEALERADESLGDALDHLRGALKSADAVEGLVIMPLIKATAETQTSLRYFLRARRMNE
jgi:hypothetical protein